MQLNPFLPVQPDQEALLREMMTDLHDTFKQRVKESRGNRLAGADEEEICSGRAFTGRQALKLGLVDCLGDLKSVMLEEFGDKARFLRCSPQPGTGPLSGLLGGSWELPGLVPCAHGGDSDSLAGSGDGRGGGSVLGAASVLAGSGGSSEAMYELTRAGIDAAVDAADEQVLWTRFKLQ